MRNPLSELLQTEAFVPFLEYIPSGAQLTAFMSLVWGIKPAMDVWVNADNTAAFVSYTAKLGLHAWVQGHMDRQAFTWENAPKDRFTTTHAVWCAEARPGAEAHIFLARTAEALDDAVSSGWYPVLIDGYLIEKHLSDHSRFGDALGYPDCCQNFFRVRNNWHTDNTYYASAQRTAFSADWRMNSFLRHTPYTLLSHMPCSASCQATLAIVEQNWSCLVREEPLFAEKLKTVLEAPILCLNENRIFQFVGATVHEQSVEYIDVLTISPTLQTDPIYRALRTGDTCVVEGNIIRVFACTKQVYAQATYTDQYGPECPFVMMFRSD